MKTKTLASKLNNRIEIWRNIPVENELGFTYIPVLLRKVWADVVPQNSGSLKEEAANTVSNTTKFKIKMRKNDVKSDDFLKIDGLECSIDYIIKDFNRNSFIEISASLKVE